MWTGVNADSNRYIKCITIRIIEYRCKQKSATKQKSVLHMLSWVFPLSSSVVVVEKVWPTRWIQSSFCHQTKPFQLLQTQIRTLVYRLITISNSSIPVILMASFQRCEKILCHFFYFFSNISQQQTQAYGT